MIRTKAYRGPKTSGRSGRSRPLALLALLLLHVPGLGQVKTPLTLPGAVELARRHFPAIRAARAEVGAAEAGSDVARTSRLPRTEFDWQQTRGTRNNIFGPFLPQTSVNPISGPILQNSAFNSTIWESVWGSGGGLAVTWEVFDFGLRQGRIDLAERLEDGARARAGVTEFETAVTAADRYLAVVAAAQVARSAAAAVERMESFAHAVETLVRSELRPGSDSSRIQVELAVARHALIEAQQQEALLRVALAEAIGMAGETLTVDGQALLTRQPPALPKPLNSLLSGHPLRLRQQSVVEIINARKKVLDRSIYPRLSWQTNLFGRGSGARIDGSRLGNRGFYPDTANWLTGLTLTFTPSEIFRLRASRRQEEQNLVAEKARLESVEQQLKSEEARARALAAAAAAFAENAPRQLEAARLTELRVRKRYDAELGTVIEVAEAQRLLTQAEVGFGLANLAIWRARLAECRAHGDLEPLLALLRQGGAN
ncbi:MAG: TolC family protein [Acidobacteriota bacterium]